MKAFVKILFVFVFVFFILITVYLSFAIESAGDTINKNQEDVIYNLPYPGLLPDHPLYIIKLTRDKLTEFLTRDYSKKAELYLLNSDKRAIAGYQLAKKGKNKLAISTFSKGEKYFLKIPQLIKQLKQQGGQPPNGFIETLKLANAKHHQLILEMFKIFPQGNQEDLELLLKLNLEVKKAVETLP